MKVIFLDFNGVLDKHDNMNVINIDNLMRLKNIVDETNAKIVISSSIRISYYYSGKISNLLKYVMDEITSCGMDIIGFTPLASNREEEIKLYLYNHPEIENYCIIDDDYNMDDLRRNLVKLPNQMGLDDIHMNMAIHILNRKK